MLDKGSYGCVLKPSIPCKRYYQNSVSKIFHKEKYFKEEKIISDMMMDIDVKNNFTTKKLDECIVDIISKKDMKACNYRKNEFPKHQIIYEYGGDDLSKFKEGEYDMKSLLPAIYNLTKGLLVLKKNRICHRDLKETNIVYKNNLFYMIDFGMALSYDNVYDDEQDFVLKYNYCYYPPEFKLYYNYKFYKKNTNISSIGNIDKFIQKDIKLNYDRSEIVYDGNIIEDMIKNVLSNIDNVNVLKTLMIGQAKKIDIFSFGVIMMNLLLKSNNKYRDVKIKLLTLFERCIELNPYRRISPIELNREMVKIIRDS